MGFKMGMEPPEVSVVLSGMNTMEYVKENLRIANDAQPNSLTIKELELVNQAKMVFKEKLEIGCTGCGYCLPCPAGVNIPENFAKYNDYHMFGSPERKERFKFGCDMMLNGVKASECTKCRQCEEHCTQGIPII